MNGRPGLVAAIAAVALVASGCGTEITGTPIAEGYVPPALASFYDQTPKWGSCAAYATDDESRKVYDRVDISCARLLVPLDYSSPNGMIISLGLLKVDALNPSRRIGSLIMNPAGRATPACWRPSHLSSQISDTDLAARFDLVGFDPRGVGASLPEVHCLTDAEQDRQRLEVPLDDENREADREQIENQQYATDCAKRTGDAVLANIGTRDVAKDLDIMRAALGDEKLTYLGYSYGTAIGTRYAADFPKNVRAMILDGAVDPDQDETDANLAQGSGFSDAFDAFAQWCAKQTTCGIGTDPAADEDQLDKLSDPLKTKPIEVGSRQLSYQDIQTAVSAALYSQDEWPTLNKGLIELGKGQGEILLGLADDYLQRNSDGHYSNTNDVFNAVRCADYPPVKDRQTLVQQEHSLRPERRRRPVDRRLRAATGHLRVLAGAQHQPALRTQRARPPAGPGRLHHPRPGDPVPARGEPGQGPQRQAAHLRRHPAHRVPLRQQLHRQMGHQLPGRADPAAAGHDLLELTALPPPIRKPSTLLGIARVLVLCVASAVFGWFVVTNAIDLGYADGWAGTPGTISAASCLTDGPVTCSAQFTPTGAGGTEQDVGITGHDDLSPGMTYSATLHGDGENATVIGTKSTMETLYGLALFTLMFVLAVGYGVVAFTQRLGRGRGWWRWEPSPLLKLTPAILAVLFGLIAGISEIVATHSTL